MVRKIISVMMLCLVGLFANEYLVQVDLDEERLMPLAEQDFIVIAELSRSALLVVNEDKMDRLDGFSHRILDVDPEEGMYYLVKLIDTVNDHEQYGDILFHEEDDVLIKIDPARFEDLIKERIMIKRLQFHGIDIQGEAMYPQFRYDPTIQEIVDQIDPDSVIAIVQRLQDYVSRYSTYDSCFAAANWIYDKLVAYGCDSVYLQYHESGHAPNVVGIKNGAVYPQSIYTVVCGHFDATSNQAPTIAPGADDNASGTAGVIEAARVMKDYAFEYSVRYIAFSGEEFGLYGSQHYAQEAYYNGDSILGVFNGDMIGYSDYSPEDIEVIAKISSPPCEWLADFFIAAADTYTTLLTDKNMTNNWIPSDNQSFLDYGYPALLNIEDYYPTNPHYHLVSDTIGAGYDDNELCTETIRAQTAALSIMAVPYQVSVSEQVYKTVEGGQLTVVPSIGHAPFILYLKGYDRETPVRIKVYDVTGTEINDLAVTDKPVLWQGTDASGIDVPAGVYFLSCADSGFQGTVKLLIMR